jgi:UDP-N-acetylglucosamine--N-acetylmuramyl-(pentapeptide) pyrophosphoryl-undecaprenol N-acetylglucosamine transferase
VAGGSPEAGEVRVVIAGGGTAGHVNPAIAIARALGDEEVVFFGTTGGAEAHLVPAAGFPLLHIEVRGFDRARPLSIFAVGARAAGAARDARRLLREHRPDVVLGMGGYVSLPVCLAARSLRIPIVLHEQNAVLGLANRLAKPLAKRVAVSFEETLDAAGPKGVYTGVPVLQEVASFDVASERRGAVERYELEPGRKTLLVFGGSQGAARINDAAAGLAPRWRDRSDVQVLHITGRAHADEVSRRIHGANGPLIYRVIGYAQRMTEPYAVAEVAVCRGGASTVAEICVAGLPAVIVPYPYHRDRQQERHGRTLERAGSGVVVPDAELTTERLEHEVGRMLDDGDRRERMRKAALALARPNAADHVARILTEVAA